MTVTCTRTFLLGSGASALNPRQPVHVYIKQSLLLYQSRIHLQRGRIHKKRTFKLFVSIFSLLCILGIQTGTNSEFTNSEFTPDISKNNKNPRIQYVQLGNTINHGQAIQGNYDQLNKPIIPETGQHLKRAFNRIKYYSKYAIKKCWNYLNQEVEEVVPSFPTRRSLINSNESQPNSPEFIPSTFSMNLSQRTIPKREHYNSKNFPKKNFPKKVTNQED